MSAQAMIASEGAGPRARRDDRLSSHVAADESARTLICVTWAVGHMLSEFFDEANGVALNDFYAQNYKRMGWPRVSWDSPRKRAGEMYARKELASSNEDRPEEPRLYCLPEKLGWFTELPSSDFDTVQERNDAGDI